jgi:hypothetical protein
MIANITLDDGLILPHSANPTGSNFRERQLCSRPTSGESIARFVLARQRMRFTIGTVQGLLRRAHILLHSTRGTMAPFKPKPRQPPMTKAELRAQGIQALAQVTTPIMKLPMKIRRQCGRCGDFNSVLVEPGQAVPAFKCSACGYAAG